MKPWNSKRSYDFKNKHISLFQKYFLFYHLKPKTIQGQRADWNILIWFTFLLKFIQLYSSYTIYLCSWSGCTYLKEQTELLYHPSRRIRGKKTKKTKTAKHIYISFYVLFSIWNFPRRNFQESPDERDQINSETWKHLLKKKKSCLRKTSMCYQYLSPQLCP